MGYTGPNISSSASRRSKTSTPWLALMRHQHRKGHRLQDAPRRSAQSELAKTRVPIAAYHHQIGSGLKGIREKCASDVVCARQPLRLSMDLMSAQMVHDPEAKRLAIFNPIRNHDNLDPFGSHEQGHRDADGAGSRRAPVPGDQDGSQLTRSRLDIGND